MSAVDDLLRLPTPFPKARWVNAKDRLRVKMYNSQGTGQDFQAKLVIKFVRPTDLEAIKTCTKILTPGNDRGTTLGNAGASFPFGAAAGVGRSVSDAIITGAPTGTITSATANLVAGDVGKAYTLQSAVVAGTAGPNMPTSTLQGTITAVGGATTATIVPNATVNGTGLIWRIEPVLLGDEDGLELGDCWVVGLDINFWQTNSRRGQAFFEVELNRGAFNMHEGVTFMRGYLGTSSHLTWPDGQLEYQVEGKGWIRTFVGTDPAAGVEISETVPTNARWEIVAMRYVLVTDATVANRFPTLRFQDESANIIFDASPQAAQTATLTTVYDAGPGVTATGTAIINSRQALSLPVGLQLFQGWQIKTSTAGLVAGDNYTAPVITVQEWIED